MKLLLLIDTMIHYDRELLKGVLSQLSELNINITVHSETVDSARSLLDRDWDYVIADYDKEGCREFIESIDSKRLVYSNTKIECVPDGVRLIYNDNQHISNIALGQFINDGISHVSVYSDFSDDGQKWAVERKQAFSSLAQKLGCCYHDDVIAAITAVDEQLGVFCTSDRSARKFVRYCVDHHIAVPDKVSIIGIDFDEIERDISPIPISSVELNPKQLGQECLTFLLEARPRNKQRVYKPELFHQDRSTTSDGLTDEVVNRALLYIHNHFHRNIKIQQVTDNCRVSRKTLDKRFLEVKGVTAHQYLSDLRIAKSKQLLKDPTLSIESIARQCGYPGQSYLNQLYRKTFGFTPSEYREQQLHLAK